MTEEQAKKLRALVRRLVRAEVAGSWKGAAASEDMPGITAARKAARRALNAYLRELAEKKP